MNGRNVMALQFMHSAPFGWLLHTLADVDADIEQID